MTSVSELDLLQFDFKKLSVLARIDLIGKIWDSIEEDEHPVTLTTAQREELDRRIEAHRQNPDDGIPWEEIKARRIPGN